MSAARARRTSASRKGRVTPFDRIVRSKLAWLAFGYVLFLLINALTDEYSECVTASWCISSKGDLFVMPLLQVATIVLMLIGLKLGLTLSGAIMASPLKHWFLLAFFCGLSALGLFAWFATVPAEDRLDFIHIPIICLFLLGLGGLMFWGFHPNRAPRGRKTTRKRTRRT